MSDNADRADLRIADVIQSALDQTRRAHRLHSDGRCQFCDELVSDGLLFCNVDCRDDYEKQQAALRRAGA
ncbi:hypothetical protein [Glaciimonas sp. PCH181]|uniref:hypothetical protein n=1 Tax=Glaciimonas sp. PCH181 TaxID=2133943 RepID=UPI000D36F16D|nr:hypothetical protein [Glaciimonas sp. PCH181]PUA16808.1 hypothetical protein C7W93_22770 [Glaciimonas sp. PCH181]